MYFPAPPPCAIPILAAQNIQKFFNPGAGPARKLSSGVWVIGPQIILLIPTSLNCGILSIPLSKYFSILSKSGSKSSISNFQSIPSNAQAATSFS